MKSESELLSCFDKVYIINLPERSDRREEMLEELHHLSKSVAWDRVIFFPAVRPSDRGEFRSIGARGCFLSHLEVLRDAEHLDVERILILEDDLAFSDVLLGDQPSVVAALQARQWDMAYLGHALPVDGVGPVCFEPFGGAIATTHFVAVDRRVRRRLIEFLELLLSRPGGHPDCGPMDVDGAYTSFRLRNADVVTLVAQPNLGTQRSSRSDIAAPKWFDKLPVISTVAAQARHVWNRARREKRA